MTNMNYYDSLELNERWRSNLREDEMMSYYTSGTEKKVADYLSHHRDASVQQIADSVGIHTESILDVLWGMANDGTVRLA